MTRRLLLLCWLFFSVAGHAAEPAVKFVEVKVLGEAAGPGGRVVVREFRVDSPQKLPGTLADRHYYRLEFYALGMLQHCYTFWDLDAPRTVSVIWTTRTAATVTMMDGWVTGTFDSERDPVWSLRRRTN